MGWWQRLRGTVSARRVDDAVDNEVAFHLEMRVEQYIAEGMSPEEARRAAAMRFGNRTLAQERTREADTFRWLDDAGRDLRYGARLLRRSPGLTTVAVLSLALGIGANTAIFSLLDAVALKSLPVREPERLVLLEWAANAWPEKIVDSIRGGANRTPQGAISSRSFSYPVYEALSRDENVFDDVAAFADAHRLNVLANGTAEFASGLAVSGNYFSALGVAPVLGRLLGEQDDRAGAARVAVLSYRYWTRRFGRDPSVISKTIVIRDLPYTIAGVAPREFFGMAPGTCPDVFFAFAPGEQLLHPPENASLFTVRDWWWARIVGRLQPGVELAQAQARAAAPFRAAIGPDLAQEAPANVPRLVLHPGSHGIEALRKEFSEPLLILMAVVGLVLAIACTNVANLLLARAAARQRETEIRLAIGASRGRLVRQHLAESLLLSAIGGALGFAVAQWGARALLAIVGARSETFVLEVRPDLRMLAFTAAISIGTGLFFGLAPALRSISEAWRPSIGPAGSRWFGKSLVAGQVALSLVLLVGAGLFIRSLQKIGSIDIGIRTKGLLLFGVNPTANGYPAARVRQIHEAIYERVRGLPGVQAATFAHYRLFDGAHVSGIEAPGRPVNPRTRDFSHLNFVGPAYFETLDIPIRAGRALHERDHEGAPPVAVANETFVRQYLRGRSPVGTRVHWEKLDIEIVGVARDAKYTSLREDAPPTLYLPYSQHLEHLGTMHFHLHIAAGPSPVIPRVREVVAAVDPRVPLFDVRMQADAVNDQVVTERLFATLCGGFGVLGLTLAIIGVYGVLSYAVTRRTREIGIRVALGAEKRSILWTVAREAATLLAIGVAVGVPLALALARLVASRLYGLKPNDPVSIGTAAAVLLLAALLAGLAPVRAATRIEPVSALRHE